MSNILLIAIIAIPLITAVLFLNKTTRTQKILGVVGLALSATPYCRQISFLHPYLHNLLQASFLQTIGLFILVIVVGWITASKEQKKLC